MDAKSVYRRKLLTTACAGAVLQYLPGRALAQSGYRVRQEWKTFRKTAQYQSFLKAIAAMRANTNPGNRNSLQFWANVHVNYCPHGTDYFIAWHRGYLHFFERQLQIVSGDPSLNLPYWDYFSYANLPAEFTDRTRGNPLYLARQSKNVYAALDLSPFAPDVYNFQHGTVNAFEPKLENLHNPVHNIIGGVMASMQSPLDPIFYVHHANIDRLTHAWALPDGKGIPFSAFPYSASNSDPYWAGNHVYASDLSLERYLTLIPYWLNTDYQKTNVPTALPPAPNTAPSATSSLLAKSAQAVTQRPPLLQLNTSSGREVSSTRRSLGGLLQVPFDEGSATVRLRLNKNDAMELGQITTRRRNERKAGQARKAGRVKLVIDRAVISDIGREGGYFYALYLNMPDFIDSSAARTRSYIGNLGAFEIAAASHHGPARLEYDIADLLAEQGVTDFSELSLSWVRVNGEDAPLGRTIQAGEIRAELASDQAPVEAPPLPKPPGWYRGRRG